MGRMKRERLNALKYSAILISMVCVAAARPALGQGAITPEARTVMDEAVRAYRALRTLDQETTYDGGPVIKAHLTVQRPNRLLFEVTEHAITGSGSAVRRFLCDGKMFYSYSQEKGIYTQALAPRDFSGFHYLASTVELAALTGVDAVSHLLEGARSGRLVEPAVVDGVQTDVVSLDMGNEDRTGEVRLYFGQSDHLLRRFTFDSKPIPKPVKQPDPPDDPNLPPLDPETPGLPLHVAYDNRVMVDKPLAKDTFRWIRPADALLYTTAATAQPRGKKGARNGLIIAQPVDTSNPTEPQDLSKPTRKITAGELMKRAKKK